MEVRVRDVHIEEGRGGLHLIIASDIFVLLRSRFQGLPWWRNGQESACQCRGHGFEPWSRKIPHVTEQLSLCATTTEPVLWSPRATTTEPARHNYYSPCAPGPALRNKRSHRKEKNAHHNEKNAHHNEEQPPFTTTRESPHTAMKTQYSQK